MSYDYDKYFTLIRTLYTRNRQYHCKEKVSKRRTNYIFQDMCSSGTLVRGVWTTSIRPYIQVLRGAVFICYRTFSFSLNIYDHMNIAQIIYASVLFNLQRSLQR